MTCTCGCSSEMGEESLHSWALLHCRHSAHIEVSLWPGRAILWWVDVATFAVHMVFADGVPLPFPAMIAPTSEPSDELRKMWRRLLDPSVVRCGQALAELARGPVAIEQYKDGVRRCQFCGDMRDAAEWRRDTCPACGRVYDPIGVDEE
jgi:hypothetical protein